jgi:hypothetical protein
MIPLWEAQLPAKPRLRIEGKMSTHHEDKPFLTQSHARETAVTMEPISRSSASVLIFEFAEAEVGTLERSKF